MYYVLVHTISGKECYFDRCETVLERVTKAICRDGSFTPTARKTFLVQPNKKKKYYLSQLLYSIYHNKPLSWVRQGRVNFNDRNNYNLTSSNLSHSHADEADNINRYIWHDCNYIFLYVKKNRKRYFCDYHPELFELLCHYRILWGYQPDMGRLQATVIKKKRKMKDLSFGFHSLVYAFHHYGARKKNFIGAIRKMKKDFIKANYSIDHLDNNQENNLIWNLSAVSKADNSAKGDIIGKIRWPFFFYAIYKEDMYRIACGRFYFSNGDSMDLSLENIIDPTYEISLYICKDSQGLISLARHFYIAPCEDGLSPQKQLQENPNAICLQNYFGDFGATAIRELLISKSINDFAIWPNIEDKNNAT